jgi:type IV pilus assembly protein PilB
VAKARALGLAPFNVARYKVSAPRPSSGSRRSSARKNLVLPVGQVGDFLLVAFANPFDTTLPTKIQEMTGSGSSACSAASVDIREKFKQGGQSTTRASTTSCSRSAPSSATAARSSTRISRTRTPAPIIQLANRIIEDAYFSGTSDIHIEPQEKEVIVRYRIDGLCQEKLRLPKPRWPAPSSPA